MSVRVFRQVSLKAWPPPLPFCRYTAAKRFGLEGAESLIPGMKALIDTGADLGVENVVIGMPHRGRLNVLANVVRKPMSQIFSEFSGAPQPVGIRAWCKIPLHSGCDSHAESAALERRMFWFRAWIYCCSVVRGLSCCTGV
eukprot:scaffold44962_cov18-Tisochrysis_lutea.AAC.4